MYTSPQRRRHQCTYRRSPDGDPDPSKSEWDSVSMVLEMSSINRRQRGEGTYDPKMDRKIFLPKLMDISTKEACQILNDMKRSLPGEVGIQCDALLRAFYELSQRKGEPVGKYSMHLDSAANKVHIRFPG